MSEQPPQRQLAPEERDYLKSKTRTNNLMGWFAGLGIFGMVAIVVVGLIPIICFCALVVVAVSAQPQ